MSPVFLRNIFLIFSFKRELKIVVWLFIFVISLPLFAILVLTNAGIPAVSNKLASVKLNTNLVAIHNPLGNVIANINASTTWPIHGVVTLEFGESDLPYQPIHTGIDIAGANGTSITPFMKGTVMNDHALTERGF